ncbi:MAG: hypothetical protein IT555_00575 [Acetobacteraceae bacterium]|nr:hypothetical protein [Acetobacteraceae bacterium]
MKLPTWTSTAIWSGLGGAAAMTILGFSVFGWSTGGAANRMADERASAAVVSAMVPFCVAKAKADADPAHMAKLKGETSSYTRADIVRSSGWATLAGMTSPDYNLSSACSEKLGATAGS